MKLFPLLGDWAPHLFWVGGPLGQSLGGGGGDASYNTNFQGVGPFFERNEFGLGIHIYFCLSMSFFMAKSFLKTRVISTPSKRSFIMYHVNWAPAIQSCDDSCSPGMAPTFNPLLPPCLLPRRGPTDLLPGLEVFSSLSFSSMPSPAGPGCFLSDGEGLAQIDLL